MATPGDDNLLLAIPKKGRLYDRIVKVLAGAGLDYHRESRVDIALCSNLPVTLVFLPAADIAMFVGEGNLDMGITGQDIIQESYTGVTELMELGFGKCRLGVQTPVASKIADPKELVGKRIVTSFPNIAKEYFKSISTEGAPETSIKYLSGSVEAACNLGLADGIVDLVETGTTMKAAGLELISTIMNTQAVLIANPNTKHPDLVNKIHQRIHGYILANKYKMLTYNIHRSKVEEAKKIAPGRRSPTVNTLTDAEYCSVQVMVEKPLVNDVMDELHDLGAMDLVVTDIENCRA